MSNRGQRPRYSSIPQMLPGGQYAAGQVLLFYYGLDGLDE